MCVSRDDLDACQLAAGYLRDVIADRSTLPLRYIHLVLLGAVQNNGHVSVWRSQDDGDYQIEISADAEEDYSLSRLNNAFIEFLSLRNGYDQSLPTFCDRTASLNFEVGKVSFDDHLQETETLNGTAKCLAEKLEATSYELSLGLGGFGEPTCVMLPSALQHEAVRSTTLFLTIQIYPGAHTLSLFDLALHMNSKARLTLMFSAKNGDGVTWAGDFIRKFIVAEDTSRVPAVIAVMQYVDLDDPLENYMPDACTVPSKRGIDAPDIRFAVLLSNPMPTKSDLYVFRNATGGKELHVHAFKAREMPKNERKVYGEYAMFVMTTV